MTELIIGWLNIPMVPIQKIYAEELEAQQEQVEKTINHQETQKQKIKLNRLLETKQGNVF